MCGIAGFCGFGPHRSDSEAILRRMNRALAHRGPDGEGIYCRDGIGLAHMRLAVVDLEGGAQPFVSDDGQTVLILNGEIYNHDELRNEMIRDGRRFRTRSDTEVVLQLYQSIGERCVDRLRGMFAFALWDQRDRRLWLVRDRLGLKPLYYSWDGGTFVFGSEPKALLEYPGVSRVVDERAVEDFLTFGYVPSPRTMFQGISKLEAGHMLSVTARGLVGTRYWDLDFSPAENGNGASTVADLRHALGGAVAGQLGSDVPVGALLSGGMDSTAVLGFMWERMSGSIPAFTASFPDTRDEDRTYARMAAEHYGSEWHDIPVPEPSEGLLDRLAWHFDEPFADPSAVPTFVLCEGAKKRVTVCLSGDGGDESFGGYRRYRENETRLRVRRMVPERNAASLLAAAGNMAPGGKWLPKPFRLGPLFRSAAVEPMDAYGTEMSLCDPTLKERLYRDSFRSSLDGYDARSTIRACFERSAGWDSTSQLQYTDFKTYLADGILTKVDRASMAHGLEVRVPLLDHTLVELIARMPSTSKVAWGRGKRLLKRTLRGLVPAPILDRRKRGFTPPLNRWLEGGVGQIFERRVLARESFVSRFLDTDAVRTLWTDHRAGIHDRAQLIWSLLVLETWGRRFQ
jgi:asparagine synthase (glutamine-hydrolysing)